MELKMIFKTQKSIVDEPSKNAQLLIKAGFVDRVMAGVYTLLPLGLRVLKKIEDIIREEIVRIGGQEVLMPALQPKEVWQATGRWETFDALFKVESHYDQKFALGPTHEEIIVPLAKKFIQSYKDLPLYLFQIQTKFRDEARAKSGLLRGREFGMKDLYSFHADEKDLDAYYEIVKKAYFKIFKRLGLKPLLVEASGGTFSKYSHEFQVLTEAGEDEIFYCQCGFAQNKEIFNPQTQACPNCQGEIKKGKAIEIGNIFKLKTKYSEPFNLKFKDKDGIDKLVIMGCYGIGTTRLLGTIAEIYNDDHGLIWPESIAPAQAIIIPLSLSGAKNLRLIKKLRETLQKVNLEVIYDDRPRASLGEKFVDADLLGIPWRIVINKQTITNGLFELKQRSTGKIYHLTLKNLLKKVAKSYV